LPESIFNLEENFFILNLIGLTVGRDGYLYKGKRLASKEDDKSLRVKEFSGGRKKNGETVLSRRKNLEGLMFAIGGFSK